MWEQLGGIVQRGLLGRVVTPVQCRSFSRFAASEFMLNRRNFVSQAMAILANMEEFSIFDFVFCFGFIFVCLITCLGARWLVTSVLKALTGEPTTSDTSCAMTNTGLLLRKLRETDKLVMKLQKRIAELEEDSQAPLEPVLGRHGFPETILTARKSGSKFHTFETCSALTHATEVQKFEFCLKC